MMRAIYLKCQSSALALFVPGVGADHPDDALAPDDFAIFTQFLN
jgi:hypothetical protein